MDVLSVYIVEDDMAAIENYLKLVMEKDGLYIAGHTGSSSKAISEILELRPASVILDFELQRGEGSGLDVLRAIGSTPKWKPYILVTTINTSLVIQEYARSLGADYFLYKKQVDYSEEYALDFLLNLAPVIQSHYGDWSTQGHESKTDASRNQDDIITRELMKIGISTKLKGFSLLREAIALEIDGNRRVSESLAASHKTQRATIDKAMQFAINKAWLETDVDVLVQQYKAPIRSDKGVPTVLEFVCYYAEKIQRLR